MGASKIEDQLAIKELLGSNQGWVRRSSDLNELCVMKALNEGELHYVAHITKAILGTGLYRWKIAEQTRPFGLKNVHYYSGSEDSLKLAVIRVSEVLMIKGPQNGFTQSARKIALKVSEESIFDRDPETRRPGDPETRRLKVGHGKLTS